MDLVIREATVDDLPAAAELWKKMDDFHRSLGFTFPRAEDAAEKWADGYRRTLGRFSFIWLAEKDGKAEGFLSGWVKQAPLHLGGVKVAELNDQFVTEAVRRMGVGTKLAQTAEQKFRELGVHSIEIRILIANTVSQDLWLKKLEYKPDLIMARKVLE